MTWRGCSVKRNTSATIPLIPVNPAQTNIQLVEIVASPENCARRNKRDNPASANVLQPKNQAFLRRNNRTSIGFGGTMCGEGLMPSKLTMIADSPPFKAAAIKDTVALPVVDQMHRAKRGVSTTRDVLSTTPPRRSAPLSRTKVFFR